jgi:phosphate transport system permease protein
MAVSASKANFANPAGRRALDFVATGLAILSTIIVVAPLAAICVFLVYKGASSLSPAFFTNPPRPFGEAGGGMADALAGSLVLLAIGSAIGVPVGIASGVFLAEFGRGRRLANSVRFTADVLNGVPSIVVGITVYALIFLPQKHFATLAGGAALGILMIPAIARTTEEMLLMVPNSVREAALTLGVPSWRTVLSITLRTASPGVIAGCTLAFARVAGETAPLLFFADQAFFVSQRGENTIGGVLTALPLQIYLYAISPYSEWHRLAWAGAFVLIVLILASVAFVRFVTARGVVKGAS